MLKEPEINIITGPCGAGKTTIIRELLPYLDRYEVHDLDELGVPDIPTVKWRKDMTRLWIEKAVCCINDKKSFILTGLIVPKEVEQYLPPPYKDKVKFLLLNLSWEERERRLRLRTENRPNILEERTCFDGLPIWLKESGFKYTILDVTNMKISDSSIIVLDWIENRLTDRSINEEVFDFPKGNE